MRRSLLIPSLVMVYSIASSQWTRTSGPEGISTNALASFGGTIYAGTATDGLYASTDDGKTWMPRNAGMEYFSVESIDTAQGYLLAGTFGHGVYRSSDNGETWLAPSTGGTLFVYDLAINGLYIFASASNGIYRSSDKGDTWVQTTLNYTSFSAVGTIGDTVIAASYGYTYRSTDSGETWQSIASLEGAGVWSIYVDGGTVIIGAVNEIFRSTNSGATFTTIQLPFTFSVVNVYSIASIGSLLFAATSYDGVYRSTDGGSTWSAANMGMGPKDVRALAATGTSALIAGSHYVGVYRSEDAAASWRKSMTGFPAGSTIDAMLATGTAVYAGTRDGVYRSKTNGASWQKMPGTNDTINYGTVRGLCEKNGVIFVGAGIQFYAAVYKSDDEGLTWTRSNAGMPPDQTFIFGMAVSGENILAATDDGIYYSSDDGTSWHQANFPSDYVPSIAAGANGSAYAIRSGTGIYRSGNSGVDWTISLPSTIDYVTVAARDNFAYAGSFFQGARYSDNYGGTWHASSGFPADASIFAIGPVDDNTVLAGTDIEQSWVYSSDNNGVFYSPYGEGLGPQAPMEAFAVNDSFMFGGATYNGVWRRIRPGLVTVTSEPDGPQEFALEQNYPNPFNPETQIRFSLAAGGNAELAVYDVLGRKVATLLDGPLSAGAHSVTFDGAGLASGMYFYRLRSGGFTDVKRMMLVK